MVMVDIMIITIPIKTLSVNHLYGFKGYRKFLTKEGKELRRFIEEQVDEQIDFLDLPDYRDKKLSVLVDVYENWLTKKGKVARKDVANREKFLIDSVFNRLGIDDKFIFKHEMRKIQSKTEKSIIKIEVIDKGEK